MITLQQAIKNGQLQEFIAQEEARGLGAVDRNELDRRIASLVKSRQSKSQTSRSASDDGLTGKRTRQGSDQRISR